MADTYIEIEDIRIFGQKSGAVTAADITAISPDISTQLHLLRHYATLPEEYLQSLIGKNYGLSEERLVTSDELYALLKTKGSKFYESDPVIATPFALIEFIKQKALELAAVE